MNTDILLIIVVIISVIAYFKSCFKIKKLEIKLELLDIEIVKIRAYSYTKTEMDAKLNEISEPKFPEPNIYKSEGLYDA